MKDNSSKILVLGEETLSVGDRVRLKESVNGIKATALCEITHIKNDKNISILCVYDHAKATGSLLEIENF